MDKKLHKNLNIIEISSVLVGILCIGCAAMLRYTNTKIITGMLAIIGILAEVTVVSIELMLFHLENKQYKFITIGYFLLEVLLIMLVNIKFPFMGLFVLVLFSLAKNTYRIMNVDNIYKFLGYYELCKKFGIKVKKPRKVRAAVTRKKTTTVKSPKRSAAEEPTFA